MFYLVIDFYGHLLKVLDGYIECDHFIENLMKIA